MNATISNPKLFKESLLKSVKGASCNKMLPLTYLVEIKVKDGVLTLLTTDGNNYLKCVCRGVEGELTSVVDVNLLNSLVGKFNSKTIELEKTDKCLVVKGNGTYKLELPIDENGKEIKFNNPFDSFEGDKQTTISEECYTKILKSNKNALATSLAEPCYTGYYVGERVLTTDSYKICCNDYKLLDTPVLFSADTMTLVELCKGSITLTTSNTDEFVISNGDKISIYGKFMNCIDNFNVAAILNLVDEDFEYKSEFDRLVLLGVLDRMSLFVSPFDKNNVNLHFVEEGVIINSLQGTGEEIVKYSFRNEGCDFTCSVDIQTLKQQIASQTGDYLEIWYGKDRAIKLIDGDTTQIVALSAE